MKSEKSENFIFWLISFALISCTLAFFPNYLTHPYSVSKLVPLVAIGFALLPLLVYSLNRESIMRYKVLLSLVLVNLLWSIASLIYPQNNIVQEIYGIWGRSNGFLSHLSYLVILTSAIFISNQKHLERFTDISILLGWISLVYGLLQAYSMVTIESITGNNNRSTSFFGNTNFHSAFIGFIATFALAVSLKRDLDKFRRFFFIAFCLFVPFAIYKSDAQQGFLVIYIGFSSVAYIYLRSLTYFKSANIFALISSLGLFVTILGFFQKGPLQTLVYQDSISSRGFYMRAGIKMFLDNPIFGIGFDSYRDWYRRTREYGAINASSLGPRDISDSAHNYFIDLAASGGTFVFISFVCLWFYILSCGIKLIKKSKTFDSTSTALFSSFIAFTSQMFISLPQIGLTIWGWAIGGLIIARYKNFAFEVNIEKSKSVITPQYLSAILFLVGLLITIPSFRSSHEYRKSVETQDVQRLIKTALSFPREATMLAASGGALIGIERYQEAKILLDTSIRIFPQYYESWYLYSLLPNLNYEQLSIAKKQMKILEPLVLIEKANNVENQR